MSQGEILDDQRSPARKEDRKDGSDPGQTLCNHGSYCRPLSDRDKCLLVPNSMNLNGYDVLPNHNDPAPSGLSRASFGTVPDSA